MDALIPIVSPKMGYDNLFELEWMKFNCKYCRLIIVECIGRIETIIGSEIKVS